MRTIYTLWSNEHRHTQWHIYIKNKEIFPELWPSGMTPCVLYTSHHDTGLTRRASHSPPCPPKERKYPKGQCQYPQIIKITLKRNSYSPSHLRIFNRASILPPPPVSQPHGPYPTYILYKHILIHIWVCARTSDEERHKTFHHWKRIIRINFVFWKTVHSKEQSWTKVIFYLNSIHLSHCQVSILKVPSRGSKLESRMCDLC